jgi:hypothetical protein
VRPGWALRGFADQGDRAVCDPVCRQGVVAAMPVASAGFPLFLHVRHFPAGGHLAVAANDATASKSAEAEKSNETHTALTVLAANPLRAVIQMQQTVYRSAARDARIRSLNLFDFPRGARAAVRTRHARLPPIGFNLRRVG